MIIANLSHMETIAQENGIQGQGFYEGHFYTKYLPKEAEKSAKKPVFQGPNINVAVAITTVTATAVSLKGDATANAIGITTAKAG